MQLAWDKTGQRFFEAGVDHGVLYPNGSTAGVSWNGLISVERNVSGGETEAYYVDGIKYFDSVAKEDFQATIQAFSYPPEFAPCLGLGKKVAGGLILTRQPRLTFGFSWRTKIGNDIDGIDHKSKIHIVYGATAAPSSKSYQTISDSPEAVQYQWVINAVPTLPGQGLGSGYVGDPNVDFLDWQWPPGFGMPGWPMGPDGNTPVPGWIPTPYVVIDPTDPNVPIDVFDDIVDRINGTPETLPYLPSPIDLINLLSGFPDLVPDAPLDPDYNPNDPGNGDGGTGGDGDGMWTPAPGFSNRVVIPIPGYAGNNPDFSGTLPLPPPPWSKFPHYSEWKILDEVIGRAEYNRAEGIWLLFRDDEAVGQKVEISCNMDNLDHTDYFAFYKLLTIQPGYNYVNIDQSTLSFQEEDPWSLQEMLNRLDFIPQFALDPSIVQLRITPASTNTKPINPSALGLQAWRRIGPDPVDPPPDPTPDPTPANRAKFLDLAVEPADNEGLTTSLTAPPWTNGLPPQFTAWPRLSESLINQYSDADGLWIRFEASYGYGQSVRVWCGLEDVTGDEWFTFTGSLTVHPGPNYIVLDETTLNDSNGADWSLTEMLNRLKWAPPDDTTAWIWTQPNLNNTQVVEVSNFTLEAWKYQ